MRRLYRQIYVTVILSLLLLVGLSSMLWRFGLSGTSLSEPLEVAGDLVAAALPPADAPADIQRAALVAMAARVGTELALFDADRQPIAAVGAPLPPPEPRGNGGWIRAGGPPAFGLLLPDQRWLVLRPHLPGSNNPLLSLFAFLGTVALAVGIGAFPVVKRLTRRLERLQRGVETLGAGNFAARVEVKGKDEIAQLAISFNRAAAKIDGLMTAHRLLLANASHELRTPLSRLRLGIELLKAKADPQRKAELERDIAELDQLIDEILLASRLDALKHLDQIEAIDLLGLLAEECVHYPAVALDGAMVSVRGDRRLLTRLVRNLLDNAERHGKPPVTVALKREGGMAVIDVTDEGGGIPQAERERVFDPFYRLEGRSNSTGTGLGLSLVRQIAELHGGTIAVVTAGAGETCFRVRLPAT